MSFGAGNNRSLDRKHKDRRMSKSGSNIFANQLDESKRSGLDSLKRIDESRISPTSKRSGHSRMSKISRHSRMSKRGSSIAALIGGSQRVSRVNDPDSSNRLSREYIPRKTAAFMEAMKRKTGRSGGHRRSSIISATTKGSGKNYETRKKLALKMIINRQKRER